MVCRDFSKARRVVVKLGSQVVTGEGYQFERERISWLAEDVKWLRSQGVEALIVTSGAVATGLGILGLSGKPASIPEKQACASVGQLGLMWNYREVFCSQELTVGQILLTRDDLDSRHRYQNAKNTLLELLSKGVVPIINENDTVVVSEIKFGDNDNLSSLVTNLVEADLLVILSDVEGLYDSDPKVNPEAKLVSCVEKVDEIVEKFVGDSKTSVGTGGMATKLNAAKRAVHRGSMAVIASGKKPHILRSIFEGKDEGTYFPAMEDRLTRRKHWIAYTIKSNGSITVDEGAASAILNKGTSLLPKGIIGAEGDFDRGDAVKVVTKSGALVAKGLTNYNLDEVVSIAGLASWEIVDKLGYKYYDEVIHRDDLVVLQP